MTGLETTTAAEEAALQPAARRRTLDVLAQSRHPLDAQAVAAALDVHVTTARFHLDQLEVAGLVQRRAAKENRPGRPRMVYALSAALREADAREQLIEVLARALGDTVSGANTTASPVAVRAGERWADELAAPAQPGESAEPADTVGDLMGVLDSLGFEPELGDGEILMRACPFRAAARDRPEVVCAVHRGLIDRMLGGTADPQGGSRLHPFVEPELCTVTVDSRA
jgi:predicted ArsR family transcriptional regulator